VIAVESSGESDFPACLVGSLPGEMTFISLPTLLTTSVQLAKLTLVRPVPRFQCRRAVQSGRRSASVIESSDDPSPRNSGIARLGIVAIRTTAAEGSVPLRQNTPDARPSRRHTKTRS
jgi:hypothetical protein